jgi:hypothetical protein
MPELNPVLTDQIMDELAALRGGLETAAEDILGVIEKAMACTAKLEDPQTRVDLDMLLFAALEACAFQDLAGQRLSNVARLLAGISEPSDPLLAGPQRPGAGLDQGAADALFGGPN